MKRAGALIGSPVQDEEIEQAALPEFRELLRLVERKLEAYATGANSAGVATDANWAATATATARLLQYQRPECIQKRIEDHLQCILDGQSAGSQVVLERFLDDLLQYSVRTDHVYFLHRLYGATDPIGQLSELLLSILNNSPDTFSAAPFLVVLERQLIQALSERVGWEAPRQGDGLFCPGGSYANLLALTTARHAFQRRAELETSVPGHRHHCREPHMGVFTSAQGHYSVRRNASILGLCDAPGETCSDVFLVPCDEQGRMDVGALRRLVHGFRNARPDSSIFVNVTAGTTVLSAFDPLPAIWKVLEEAFHPQLEGISVASDGQGTKAEATGTKSLHRASFWIHVDGALGGSFLFSTQFRSTALNGLEKYADSFVLNAHKLLGAPLQCSVLLVREHGLLLAAHAARASYLFHDDFDTDAQYDIGDMTLTCSRRSDALKFWLMWMWRGSAGFAARVDQAVWNARRIAEAMMQRPCFLLVGWSDDQHTPATNVCFYYLPLVLRGKLRSPMDIKTEKERKQLGCLSVRLCRRLQVTGKALINYCTLGGSDLPVFLRLALHGICVYHEARVQELLNVMERCGDELCAGDLEPTANSNLGMVGVENLAWKEEQREVCN
jgi:glutamate/tyrosine decarboxylase-like PLP-dependent enzyme